MPLDLQALAGAAARFSGYRDALAVAKQDPERLLRDRALASERHQKLFRPPSERLLSGRSALPRPSAPAGAAHAVISPPPQPGAAAPTITPEVLQRDNDLRPIRFMHIGMLAARAVGRIRIADSPATEGGDATGFMVAPGLLMTNWHVLKNADVAAAASVVFNDEDGLDGNPLETAAFRLLPDLLFVNDELLDYAIVEVTPRTSSGISLADFGYFRLFRETGKIDPSQRQAANIIQHPGGGPKKLAVRDNYLLEILPDFVDPEKKEMSLYYGTDTLKGSSGSPVCSDQWYVAALHRGGVPETKMIDGKTVVVRRDGTPASPSDSPDALRYLCNEGTRVSRIYRSLEEKAPTSPDAAAALDRIGKVATSPRLGPINLQTAPILLPGLLGTEGGAVEEITRRSSNRFEGATGYSPTFLGEDHPIHLPQMTSEVEREVARLKGSDESELKYEHFSVVMNKERRTAFFAAGNIDGSQLWGAQHLGGLPKRPSWSWDPRLDEQSQPDDTIFGNAMQRGHLFKREDAVWGSDRQAMKRADELCFSIPNATPMIGNFNNVEWGDLEDIITRECQAGNKVSYFAGPVFRSTDSFFNELRANVPATERRKGMRVPQSFWKIVAWVEEDKLKAAGFMLSQADEIERHGPILEEMSFGAYRQTSIGDIEQATGLRFPELRAADTHPS